MAPRRRQRKRRQPVWLVSETGAHLLKNLYGPKFLANGKMPADINPLEDYILAYQNRIDQPDILLSLARRVGLPIEPSSDLDVAGQIYLLLDEITNYYGQHPEKFEIEPSLETVINMTRSNFNKRDDLYPGWLAPKEFPVSYYSEDEIFLGRTYLHYRWIRGDDPQQ